MRCGSEPSRRIDLRGMLDARALCMSLLFCCSQHAGPADTALLASDTCGGTAARVKAFVEQAKESLATFFNHSRDRCDLLHCVR
jgi:hypothetical protein